MKLRKSLLLCLAALAVCLALSACSLGTGGKNSAVCERYEDAELYSVGSFSYSAAEVGCVELHWCYGDVTLVESDAAALSVTESGEALADEARLHWRLDEGTLSLYFGASGATVAEDKESKALTVQLPRGVKLSVEASSASLSAESLTSSELDIELTSGNITLGTVASSLVELDTVSGNIEIESVTAEVLDCESSSGHIELDAVGATFAEFESVSGRIIAQNATVQHLKCESSSGIVRIKDSSIDDLKVNTISGDIRLTVSKKNKVNNANLVSSSGTVNIRLNDCGALMHFSSNSGRLKTQLEYTENKDKSSFVFGKASSVFNVKTTSGNLVVG